MSGRCSQGDTTTDASSQADGRHAATLGRRVRVLVVEDNGINRQLFERQLTKLGHDFVMVDRAAAALDLLAAGDHGFDVVLMDCQLPDLDGPAATERLRDLERATGRHLPVIAVTAGVMAGDRAACCEAGMDDFLAKPVSVSDLASAIARWSTASLPA